MKKRAKKYRPKKVEIPAIFYRFGGDLSERELQNFEFNFRTHANAMRSRSGINLNSVNYLSDVFKIGHELAKNYEYSAHLQSLMLFAFAACQNLMILKNRGQELPEELYPPIMAAIEVLFDQFKLAHRDELVAAIREVRDHYDEIMNAPRGSCFLFYPGNGPTKMSGRRCGIFINDMIRIDEMIRIGELRHNEAMRRWEVYDSSDDTTIPVYRPSVIIFEQPFTEAEMKEIGGVEWEK